MSPFLHIHFSDSAVSEVLMKALARLCLSAAAVLISAATVHADTHTLSGIVYGGSQPLPGVVVDALEYNTTRVVATSTTNSDGRYAMALSSNTYDLRITPPPESGYGTDMVRNFAISGEDRVYDILLFSSEAGSLSGTIRGRNGQPVPDATVYVNIGAFSEATTTNALGQYAISTINGRVYLQVFGNGPGSVAPESWYIERYDVIISGPTVFNLDLPVSRLTGAVQFNDGTPAPGAVLDLIGFGTVTNGRTYSTASATADLNGLYSVFMLDGSVRGVATPPPGALVPQDTETFTIAGDTGQNFRFPSASRVTGTIRGRNGLAVSNATVYLSVGSTVATALTDADGHYFLDAENGPAYLQVWGGGPTGAAPSSFYLERYDVTINGATQLDLNLPVVRIAGAVKNDQGVGVVGATVSLSTSNSPDNGRSTSYDTQVSGDNGAYESLVLTGAGIATVTPPSGSGLTPQTRSFDATADAQLNFTLPPTTLIAGTVRARDGQPVPGATVTVIVGSESSSGQTDTSGHYSLSVPEGLATVQVTGGGSAGAPEIFSFERDEVAINGPTTFDVNLSVALLTGTVTDANGVLVPTVPFTAATANSLSNVHTTSSSSGVGGTSATFTALALTGAGTLTLSPLFDTGFIETTLPFDLPGDSTGRFALLHAGVAPVITMGPVIVHLSDTSVTIGWTTNRESTSIVEFGEAGILSHTSEDAALTTEHLVTLTGLSATTQYAYRVGSSDAFATGPTFSAESAFGTLASPGDFGSPIITGGPTLVFADQTSAIIEWTTDEPASSIVEFGTPRVPVDGDPGAFRLVHRVRLTGLSPNTAYPANVRSADPDGNETVSGDFTFHTATADDAAPPVITAGPTVIATSDTRIVIAWTTNEPATTGVSYNDGTAYDLGTDLALTRTHRMTLGGLTPGTLYHITASSTDAAGNGPTLSGVLDVMTNATPDTVIPTLSNVQVSDVTATRAVITWTTDEPTNAILLFVASGDSTANLQGDLDLSLAHEQAPNGLMPDTTYLFFLFSIDVAGNTGQFVGGTFTTRPLTVDNPPTKPSPVSGPASPTNAATIHITWGASTDDHGVTGYEVRRDGVAIGTVDADTLSFDDATAPEGSRTYEIGALDAVGHVTLSDPLTIVIDRTAPIVTVPGDILANAVGTTATVTFTATAIDNLDGSVAVTCTPPSGSSFSVGTTQVSCSASDTAGNTGTGTFNVIVRDVTAPVVTVPSDITREATSSAGAVVSFTATAFDVVDGSITPVCTPPSGSTFHVGLTQVVCTATDAAGNIGEGTFNVIVVDSTAPVITQFSPSLSVLTPPDHRMVNLTINLTVTDAGDPSPTCSIIAISSNEPVNGTGDGDTAPDWSFSGLTFSLRAERSGSGNGRVYTIFGECRDSAGNVSHALTTVRVPKQVN
jgi:immunomodulating metalloprotease